MSNRIEFCPLGGVHSGLTCYYWTRINPGLSLFSATSPKTTELVKFRRPPRLISWLSAFASPARCRVSRTEAIWDNAALNFHQYHGRGASLIMYSTTSTRKDVTITKTLTRYLLFFLVYNFCLWKIVRCTTHSTCPSVTADTGASIGLLLVVL